MVEHSSAAAPTPDDEWIVFTPDGSYTGSPRTEDYILWQSGEDLVAAPAYP